MCLKCLFFLLENVFRIIICIQKLNYGFTRKINRKEKLNFLNLFFQT